MYWGITFGRTIPVQPKPRVSPVWHKSQFFSKNVFRVAVIRVVFPLPPRQNASFHFCIPGSWADGSF